MDVGKVIALRAEEIKTLRKAGHNKGLRLVTVLATTPRVRAHFDVLDSLRGVAAGMVLFGHATAVMLGPDETMVPRKGLAVIFFFMLSGFVIASAYGDRLRQGMSIADFMMRRVIRLYPLITLGTLIGLIWFAITAPTLGLRGIAAAILSALALPSPHTFFSFGSFPVNPPEWSLFFEMLAYLSFAVISLSNARFISVILVSTIGFFVSEYVYFPLDQPLALLSFEAFGSFYIGVALWQLFRRGRLEVFQVPAWSLAAVIIAVCLIPRYYGPIVDYAAYVIVFPAVLALGAAKGRDATDRIGQLFGDLSFPVYILHWPFLLIGQRFIEPRFGSVVAIGVAMISAVGGGWVALRAFDQPIREWLTRCRTGRNYKLLPTEV